MNHAEQSMTSKDQTATSTGSGWVATGGEMGKLIHAKDWSKTTLGPLKSWPLSLRSALNICLESDTPIALCWGRKRVLFYNDAWKKQLEGSDSSVLGRPAKEFFKSRWKNIAPRLEQVVTTGKAAEAKNQLISSAGGEDRYFDFSFSPVRNSDGSVGGVFCIGVECAAHMHATRLPAHSDGQFREMINALPTAIYTTDAEGRLTHYNAAAVEFSGREPQLGSDQWCVTWKFYAPDGTPMAHEEGPMAVALREGRPIHGEEGIAERPDGKRIRFRAYPSPIFDEEGNLAGGINMLVDITKQNHSERLHEEQSKILELIASGASLEESLEALCQVVSKLNPGVRAAILLADEQRETLHKTIAPDMIPAYGQGLEGAPISEMAIGTCGKAIFDGKPVCCADIANDKRWAKEWRDLNLDHGIKACHSEPIFDREGQSVGSFLLSMNEAREPNAWEQRLASFGTHIASIALEHDRSHQALVNSKQQLSSKVSDMERLHRLSTELLMEEDIEAALQKVMEASSELMDAPRATVQLYNEQDESLRMVGTRNFDQKFFDSFSIVESEGITTCATAVRENRPVMVEDLSADPQYAEFARVAEAYGVEAALSTPLFNGDGQQLFGVFTMYWNQPHRPSTDKLQLLELYAQQGARLIERKKAEQALQDREQHLSALIETTPECIKVVDENGTLLQMNPAGLNMIEADDPSEAVGACIYDVIAPEYRDKFVEFNEKVCKGESAILNFDVIGLKGTRRHMESHAAPLHRPDGTIAHMALTRDVTEKRIAQTALQESEKKYRTLLDSVPVAAFVCDKHGVLQYYNRRAAEIWGREPECGSVEEKYCGSLKLYLPDGTEMPHSQSPMVDVLQDGEPRHNVEVYIEQPGGKRIPVIVNFSPLGNVKGEIEGVITSFEDISELKRTEKKLQEMNETLEERVEKRTAALLSYQEQLRSLASQLSKAEENERQRLATELHDNLGQTLAIGKMKLDLLQRETLPNRAASGMGELAELMNEAISYTRELMSDLKPPPALDKENLEEAMRWVARKMKKHGLEVTIEDDEMPKPVNEEMRSTLLQATRELLFNVVKHAGVRRAKVVLSHRKDQILVSVEDQGKGFNPDEKNLSPTDDGGFGLFNIRERMDLLGGRLEVISEPGDGTKVVLFAPMEGKRIESDIILASNGQGAATVEKPAQADSIRKVRVLLVDDHRMMRTGLRKIIEEEHDLTVIAEASNGHEAISMVNETSPDVVVMDVNMPGMNGIEATHRITECNPDVRVIGLSLQEENSVAEAMRSAGASAYLTKSEVFETLCATIRSEAVTVQEG